MTAKLTENIKSVIMLRIRQDLTTKGVPKQTIDQILAEAYFRIDNVGGKPVAFIIGKQNIPFGNLQGKSPNIEFDPILSANFQGQVIGFTVALEDVGFFDLVEASVFETAAGDLEIGDVDGASIRVTKEVAKKWKVVASAMHKGNGAAKDDNRASLGFLFNDGNWSVWAEGVHMDGNSSYPDSHWAATLGTEFKVNSRQRAVVTLSYVDSAIARVSAVYEIQVMKDLYFSPEIAYVTRADGTREWQYVARTEYRFSTK